MRKPLNLKGKRFGSLLVLDKCGVKGRHIMWQCYCEDCGEFQVIRGSSLTSGNTTTCKCHKKCHNTFEILASGVSLMYDNKGNSTLIDTDDIERLSKTYWFKDTFQRMKYWRNTKGDFLHKFLIPCKEQNVVDHKKGNLDDNRKCELRECTTSQNARNIRLNPRDLPVGVCYDEKNDRYIAYIRHNGKQLRAYFKDREPDNAIQQRKNWEKEFYKDGFLPKYKSM